MANPQRAEAPNFSSILDEPAADAVRPPPFPIGDYLVSIVGLPKNGKSTKKQTDYIEYTLQPLEAIEGTFDPDAMEEFGDLSDKTMRLTFYLTPKSAYRHTEFLRDDLGLEFEKDEGHWAAAQRTAGMQCTVHVKHTPSDDGKGVYSEISSTAPVA